MKDLVSLNSLKALMPATSQLTSKGLLVVNPENSDCEPIVLKKSKDSILVTQTDLAPEELEKEKVKDIFSDPKGSGDIHSKEVFKFDFEDLESVLSPVEYNPDEALSQMVSFLRVNQLVSEKELVNALEVLTKYYRVDVVLEALSSMNCDNLEDFLEQLEAGYAVEWFGQYVATWEDNYND